MQIINANNFISALNGTAVCGESSMNMDISSNSIASVSSKSNSRNVDSGAVGTVPTTLVCVKSISEFPLSSGILSFSIVDAAVRRYKCANENYMCDELDDYDEETSSLYCVVVHMYIVQSKSMQECNILYQPTVQENAEIKSTMSSEVSSQKREQNSSNLDIASDESKRIDNVAERHDEAGKQSDERDNVKNIHLVAKEDAPASNEKNALELLLGITNVTNSGGSSNSHTNLVSNTGGSNVVSVAAAAAAAPSVIATESITDSRNPSPKVSANVSAKSYPQVNLMTPDAFTSSSTNGTEKNMQTRIVVDNFE